MLLQALLGATGDHDSSSGALPQLLKVTSFAILEVFLLCIVGYVLGRRGVVDAKTKRTLNLLNQACFTPCLLFGKVAFTLTPSKLAELWIVPVGFVILSGASALIAYLMGTAFRLSRSQRAFAIACATFMNSNSLPIGLMQSLTYTVDELHWGKHDSHEAMLGRALSYLVLFSTLGIILRWSYGIKLLSTADDAADKPEPKRNNSTSEQDTSLSLENGDRVLESDQREREEEALLSVDYAKAGLAGSSGTGNGHAQEPSSATLKSPRFVEGPRMTGPDHTAQPAGIRRKMPERRWTALGSAGDDAAIDVFSRPVIARTQSGRQKVVSTNWNREIDRYRSFPNTPARTPAASNYASSAGSITSDDDSEGEGVSTRQEDASDEEEDYAGLGRRERTEASRSRWQAAFRRRRRSCASWSNRYIVKPSIRFIQGVRAFMTAPLYAAFLSLIVACIPPAQHFLSELLPLRNAIKSAGNCSVPVTLIVLGSYFVAEQESSKPASAMKQRGGRHKRQPSTTESLKRKFSALFGHSYKTKDDLYEDTNRRPGEGRTIFVSVVSRMVVAPLLLLPLLWFWAKHTVNVADDPVFIVTAVLVIGSAPAITLAQMTSAVGDAFERLVSKTLFVSYVIVTFPSTIILVLVGLEIAKHQ